MVWGSGFELAVLRCSGDGMAFWDHLRTAVI